MQPPLFRSENKLSLLIINKEKSNVNLKAYSSVAFKK